MLQQKKADDYVIATGEVHSVADVCQIAFSYLEFLLDIIKNYFQHDLSKVSDYYFPAFGIWIKLQIFIISLIITVIINNFIAMLAL